MNELRNWIPYKLLKQNGVWELRWMNLGGRHIAEPFFDETISICLSRMREQSAYTSLSNTDFLVNSAQEVGAIAPATFIFHVSRCGSTLLTQALSTDQANLVYAEAPLLDEILRAPFQDAGLKPAETEKWFKSSLKMMGQLRTNQYQQLFIKLDSWHIHFYPLLRKWFPDTPFYFLTRKPDAVVFSHHKRRGLHSIPGLIEAELLGVKLEARHYRDFNLFTAEVLEKYYQAIHNLVIANHPLNYFYDYSWGMEHMIDHFFNAIGKDPTNKAEMQKRLSFHSKYPNQIFDKEISFDLPEHGAANLAYQDLILSMNEHIIR